MLTFWSSQMILGAGKSESYVVALWLTISTDGLHVKQNQGCSQCNLKACRVVVKMSGDEFQYFDSYYDHISPQMLSAACAAALHRRHLMVWKIFAPRLVYEVAFFLTTSICVMLAYLFVLRVDKALTKFVDNLPSNKGDKRVQH